MSDDIIAALEAAEAGSRELDAEIWRFVDPKEYEAKIGFVCSREYTTSIDAALSLVPEGWAYSLQHVGKVTREDGEVDFIPEVRLWIPSLRTQGLGDYILEGTESWDYLKSDRPAILKSLRK